MAVLSKCECDMDKELYWCRNCSKWPTSDYDVSYTKPTTGELDNECKAKQANGTCQSS